MADATPNPNPVVPTAEDLAASVPESWRAEQAQLNSPAQRIVLIEDSQRCCLYGWLSLVPLLGTFFALPTLKYFRRVDRLRAAWNPGQHLLLRGLVLVCFGCWASLLWWWLAFWWGAEAMEILPVTEGEMGELLGCLLLFGSAPVVLGLGLAAARWSNSFGTFARKPRVGLAAPNRP